MHTSLSHFVTRSLTVTIGFVLDDNQTTSAAPPKVFQMATEIVGGVLKSGTKKSYSLHNVIFDRVSLPGRSSQLGQRRN